MRYAFFTTCIESRGVRSQTSASGGRIDTVARIVKLVYIPACRATKCSGRVFLLLRTVPLYVSDTCAAHLHGSPGATKCSWCSCGPAGHCRRGRVATTGLFRLGSQTERPFERGEHTCLTGGRSPVLCKRLSARALACKSRGVPGPFSNRGGVWTEDGVAVGSTLVFVLISDDLPRGALQGSAFVMLGPSRPGEIRSA